MDSVALEREQPRSLLARPQRWGVLPTWWFWQAPANAGLIRIPGGLLLIVATVGLMLNGAPLWLILLGPALPYLFALGLFERFVRRSALRRREAVADALASAGEPTGP